MTLEQRGWQSLCDGTGGDFCREVVAEDALMELSNGVIMDRTAVTATLARTPRWSGYAIVGAHLVSVGARCAALEYISTGYPRENCRALVGTACSMYRRGEHGWKLVLCRHTRQR